MYGVPVYEWILDKKREGILNDLQYTKQRISIISARYGFDSLSHFAHFCKDSFGDTPRALRKRLANGEKIPSYAKSKAKTRRTSKPFTCPQTSHSAGLRNYFFNRLLYRWISPIFAKHLQKYPDRTNFQTIK